MGKWIFLSSVFCLLVVSRLQALDCLDPVDFEVFGDTDAVATQGSLLGFGQGRGFTVLDLTDPAVPEIVIDRVEMLATIADIAFSGELAFVANLSGGLRVVDLSDPNAGAIIGIYSVFGLIAGVTVSGDYAYLADRLFGLRVLDIADPTTPVLVGSLATPGSAMSVALNGDFAYIADNERGLRIIDVSNPLAPVETGFIEWPNEANNVFVVGQNAYVTARQSGLRIVDVSDPDSPTELGFYEVQYGELQYDTAMDVVVAGNYAHVAFDIGGYHVIDISVPTNPTGLGTAPTIGTALAITVSDENAYLADGDEGLVAFDFSNPSAPSELWIFHRAEHADHVVIENELVYLTTSHNNYPYTAEFVIYEVTGQKLVERGMLAIDENGLSLAVAGDYAFLGSDGLRVINVSDPSNPLEVGVTATSGSSVVDIRIAGIYAYLAAPKYLEIVDISDPGAPFVVGSLPVATNTRGLDVQGDYAYLVNYDGLVIVDVSNPTNPFRVGTLNVPSTWETDVAVAGNYAFVATRSSVLLVADISDPSNPASAGSLNLTGDWGYSIVIEGDLAYVANGDGGLKVVDISDPLNPFLAVSWEDGVNALDTAVVPDFAVLADDTGGLVLFDICGGLLFGDYFESGDFSAWSDFETPIMVTTSPVSDGETWTFTQTPVGSCSPNQPLAISLSSSASDNIDLDVTFSGPFPIIAYPQSPLAPGETTIVVLAFCPYLDDGQIQAGLLTITTTEQSAPEILVNLAGQEAP